MSITGKVWGTTEDMISDPLFECHRLVIKPMFRCSLHVHRTKWNAFIVTKGRLFIEVVKNDYPLVDVTELGPGQVMKVRPGEHHSFRTDEEGCEGFEVYWPNHLSEDIDRKDHGGPVEE
jgi:mannose-6-phosphate isomerase-like protein (cupin superfamily)